MSSRTPADQAQRHAALNESRSIIVQAPAGSGKTDLLTRRFLRLLAEVDDPGLIVAITFTRAAAAEMRHRILSELESTQEKAPANPAPSPADEFSMAALAGRALRHSQAMGWQLLDQPAQLRVMTIDAFCRDIALEQPLITGLGGELDAIEHPEELYRRAARRTLEQLGAAGTEFAAALEALLIWRDNNWQEMETLLVSMLAQRDRWMHAFVLDRNHDWDGVRASLERPFANAVRDGVTQISAHMTQVPHLCDELLALAQFACDQKKHTRYKSIAEIAELPSPPFADAESLETARLTFLDAADLLLNSENIFRSSVNKSDGFPPNSAEKTRILGLIDRLRQMDGLESALASMRDLPPARYSEEDWHIVRAAFIVLRQAAGELRAVFAETGKVDFIEVAQSAQRVLRDDDGSPTDAALDLADKIHHLLVDEFQDTSRRQIELLSSLIFAWPDTSNRTCFVVGDPMQSIYSFRDADAELFPRVRGFGIELPDGDLLPLDFVPLAANFRTEPELVDRTNAMFADVFGASSAGRSPHSPSIPFRDSAALPHPRFSLRVDFMPRIKPGAPADPALLRERERLRDEQTAQIVTLIHEKQGRIDAARAAGTPYRVAVLGRTRKELVRVAQALRDARIPFRAVDLEPLRDRPEVLDALALGRALLNPQDRIAWLSVLRAPWCGLALDDLHKLVSSDDENLLQRAIPDLLSERCTQLSPAGAAAVRRLLSVIDLLPDLHAGLPTATMGTWLQQIWSQLGGGICEGAEAQANLNALWTFLDTLPEGSQDMLGPALDAALNTLTALPDPAASSECGVQLMTIHKAKGLEFEVVIVPELQARSGRDAIKLLAWLERGLAQPGDSGDITEFLVAPMQPKGMQRSGSRKWVDRIRFEREKSEMCRILYVAATRAREELYLFALPEFKTENGNLELIEPVNTLLATAWPSVRNEIRQRFDAWAAARAAATSEELVVHEIAASGESNLLVMPSPAKPTRLRRLPAAFAPPPSVRFGQARRTGSPTDPATAEPYQRHEGGQLSRALGNAVHRFMQELARLRASLDWPAARQALRKLQPAVAAQIRSAGVARAKAETMATQALDLALKASEEAHGQWILSPHAAAESEASWSGLAHGELRTIRVDRVFRSGSEPLNDGDEAWWIIDYKTAQAGAHDLFSVSDLRSLFAPQLESYAAILRALYGADRPIRAGLYYPRMLLLDWWKVEA